MPFSLIPSLALSLPRVYEESYVTDTVNSQQTLTGFKVRSSAALTNLCLFTFMYIPAAIFSDGTDRTEQCDLQSRRQSTFAEGAFGHGQGEHWSLKIFEHQKFYHIQGRRNKTIILLFFFIVCEIHCLAVVDFHIMSLS